VKRLPEEAPPNFEVRVVPDLTALAEAAAKEFAGAARDAIADHGRFTVALAGGSTPRAFHQRLAGQPYRKAIDWKRVLFFWGDERCVPPTDERSNYRMAKETLLDPLHIPAANVFRIDGEDPPARAAAAYETLLRGQFPGRKRCPRFDFCLLGMGADGHTASLFPGRPALAERRKWAVSTRSPKRDARITLTYPVFNAAGRIVFLVAGEEKSGPLAKIVKKERGYRKLPASGIRPASGSLLWLLDQAAASRL
jgi:6-phosphogluconolactonase